jgi:hypothetical protein
MVAQPNTPLPILGTLVCTVHIQLTGALLVRVHFQAVVGSGASPSKAFQLEYNPMATTLNPLRQVSFVAHAYFIICR